MAGRSKEEQSPFMPLLPFWVLVPDNSPRGVCIVQGMQTHPSMAGCIHILAVAYPSPRTTEGAWVLLAGGSTARPSRRVLEKMPSQQRQEQGAPTLLSRPHSGRPVEPRPLLQALRLGALRDLPSAHQVRKALTSTFVLRSRPRCSFLFLFVCRLIFFFFFFPGPSSD